MTPDDRKRLANYRGRRLAACRAHAALCDVIASLGVEDGSEATAPDVPPPPSEAHKRELTNAASLLLRQILIWNDGHVSASALQSF